MLRREMTGMFLLRQMKTKNIKKQKILKKFEPFLRFFHLISEYRSDSAEKQEEK